MVAKSCRDCGRIIRGSLCNECGTRRNRKRGSASQRGYDAQYRRERLTVVDQAKHGRPCVICGKRFERDELVTAEHIIPLRHGGTSDRGNLGPAHQRCNSSHRQAKYL